MNTTDTIAKTMARLEAQLLEWTTWFDQAAARASEKGHQAKAESQAQLEQLKPKLAAARAKLDEARVAGGHKWETLKDGVEHAWHDLEKAFQKLTH